jgi:class 3 adenylate cyclase
MSFGEELGKEVEAILKTSWESRDGYVVPDTESVQLGNDAVKLTGTVLYADLANSSGLVENHKDWFAAEVYKAYLVCACRIIRHHGGEITAFDGDRVMGVFIGETPNTSAAKAALRINWAVHELLRPKIKKNYPDVTYTIKHGVGIDSSPLFIARSGIRGSNDLVWVGRAANVAAKLAALREDGFSIYITEAVFKKLQDSAKLSIKDKTLMWESRTWRGATVYRSGWTWGIA